MAGGFNNPVVGGSGTLIRDSIHSPNYVPGVSGWSINKDGTAQFNELTLIVQTSGQAILIYNGSAGSGNLIGSWAASAGSDQYGNAYPAGINVIQGSLTGVSLLNSALATATITDALISGSQMQSSSMNGGNIVESVITFDTGGGGLFMYTTTTTTTTFNADGTYNPTSTGNARVQGWGAGAGAGGGNTTGGGETGGAGAYGEEPNYPVTVGQPIDINIGSGGDGGVTGQAGTDGEDTSVDGGNIIISGGSAGTGGVGGLGGQLSGNTIGHKGGNGASNPSGFSAGASGAAAAGTSNDGANGASPTGSTATTGATGTNGGGSGGNGGASGNGGNNGVSPGGAGGGAGNAPSGSSFSKSYRPSTTSSYFGSEVGQGRRNTNGAMYQGCASGELGTTGDQYSIALYPSSTIRSDFSGATIDSVTVEITNSHTWYNSGAYLIFGYAAFGSLGPTGNLSGAHLNQQKSAISEGATKTFTTTFLKSVVATTNFTCLILGPSKANSSATDLTNYGYQNGGASLGPLLKVTGHTGVGTNTAGNGANGQVKITQTATSLMVGALSPIASSNIDGLGNAVAIGYSGPVVAFQPGANPAVIEAWHTLTPPSGWSGTSRYKLLSETNKVYIDIALVASAQAAKTNFTFAGTIPSSPNYRPSGSIALPLVETNNTATTAPYPSLFINSGTGAVTAFHIDVGTTGIDVHTDYFIA